MESKLKKRRSVIDIREEAETLLKATTSEQIVENTDRNTSQSKHNEVTTPELHPKSPIPLQFRTARATLYVLCKLLNIAYVPLFIYRVFQKRKKCSPVTDPLLRIPAVQLAKKIRSRDISCERVIQAYITRIKEVNPLLNAVIDERFAPALEDAKNVDKFIMSDEFLKNEERVTQEMPLLGVPLTVKGSLAVENMKHTSGTVTRKEHIAKSDADSVALARKAGAIPLVVSNVPELCMSWETTNKLIGTTKNPHDTTRTCGGSSGGEASLLASGASLIGIGSDIAGSLRLPAHYCGVYGHKPTPAAVSFDGHYPTCMHRDKWEAVFTVGPMSRYATDLRALLGVIAVPEKRKILDLDAKVDITKIKVFYSEHEDFYWQSPNTHCLEAVKKAVGHFKNICDCEPQKVDFYSSHNLSDLIALDMLSMEDIEDIFDGNANGVFAELFRYATFRSQHTFMAIATGLLRKLAKSVPEKRRDNIRKFLTKVRKEYEDMLGENGVFILPTFPTEAPKHHDVLRTALYSGYMLIFNGLGYPVTNCPVGVTDDGLPVGIQVASLPFGDKLTLAVAEELERAFGGWVEPRDF